jgi:hypothetical protein
MVHRVSTPTLCTLHRAMGADIAKVAHSLNRVHRLVHLERLGQGNSSLGTDVVQTQAGGNQRSGEWWRSQRGAEGNGTPCQHTNILHRPMGADRARVVHSLDRVHRPIHLERLGQSNSSLGIDLIVVQAGGIRRSGLWWRMQRGAEGNGTPCQRTNTLHAAQGDESGQSKGGALTRSCAPSGSP